MKVVFKCAVEFDNQFISTGTTAIVLKCKSDGESNLVELRNTFDQSLITIPLLVFKTFTREVA